jgi:hypothetical protein
MDFSQIVKFFLDNATYVVPVLPFLPFYWWLRKAQDELAEKNIDVDEATHLLNAATLTVDERLVVRISEPAPAYRVRIPDLFNPDNRGMFLVELYIHHERFLDRIDRLLGGPVIPLLFLLAVFCSALMYVLELPKSVTIFMGVVSLFVAFGTFYLYSGWLVDIKRAFAKLRQT